MKKGPFELYPKRFRPIRNQFELIKIRNQFELQTFELLLFQSADTALSNLFAISDAIWSFEFARRIRIQTT